ncbi:MAG: DUF1517 domain-containing protein [Synechococcales cyanobacterium]
MNNLHRLRLWVKPALKLLFLILVVGGLGLGQIDGALAARGGGRMGGGSFRTPSRSFSPPTRSYQSSPRYYNNGYGGGGLGFPFLLPLFGLGGGFGGLFSLLVLIAIANFFVQNFRKMSGNEPYEPTINPSHTSVIKVQVGLMSAARQLQRDLNQLAAKTNTGTTAGLATVLTETCLALMRHPDYWVYGGIEHEQVHLSTAESQFNRWSLIERCKFSHESLINVNQHPTSINPPEVVNGQPNLSSIQGEFIIVTLLVGIQGKFSVPVINGVDDLRQALSRLGGVATDELLAVEVLWSPQQEGEALSTDEMILAYPTLKLL